MVMRGGAAVLRICPSAIYDTKPVSSPLIAKN
jgi:hypothetical protein